VRALLAGDPDDFGEIGRAAALADPDDQGVAQVGPRAVDRDGRRRRESGRDAEPDLGQVGGVERGVVGRAAGREDHVARPPVGYLARDVRDRGRPGVEHPLVELGLLGDIGRHPVAGFGGHLSPPLTRARSCAMPPLWLQIRARHTREVSNFAHHAESLAAGSRTPARSPASSIKDDTSPRLAPWASR
jgi:hypothetical protein